MTERHRALVGALRWRLVIAAPLGAALVGCGGGSDDPPGNRAPSAALASATPTGYSSQTVALDAAGSSDSDGNITSYAWTQVAGPSVALSATEGIHVSFVVPPLASAQAATFRVTVTDDDNASASRDLSIKLTPAPVTATASIGGGAEFLVEGEPIMARVEDLALAGSAVVPASLAWEAADGTVLASGFAFGEDTALALGVVDTRVTLVIDGGMLGTTRIDYDVRVLADQLPISDFQRTPAAGYQALMPVVAVTHIPTADGATLDLAEANYTYRPPEWSGNDIVDLITYVQKLVTRKKFALEERTRFRGYKDPAAKPYLGYRILAHYVFYEPLPLSSRVNPFDPRQQMVDFAAILARIDAEQWVNVNGVKEFWLLNYFNEKLQVWESNMSSPTTGDVSNSDQVVGDLPVFDTTYIVYGVNYHRTQAEAIHNYGHQIERMLDYVDRVASGTSELFWGRYVGVPRFRGPVIELGRCGWTHMPPNTNVDYDYANPTLVDSDCEDWRPDGGGALVPVNGAYFAGLGYAWPGTTSIPQKAETQFYVWWMQNMPGDGNTIPFETTTMENWWRFVADWDGAINAGLRLYR